MKQQQETKSPKTKGIVNQTRDSLSILLKLIENIDFWTLPIFTDFNGKHNQVYKSQIIISLQPTLLFSL